MSSYARQNFKKLPSHIEEYWNNFTFRPLSRHICIYCKEEFMVLGHLCNYCGRDLCIRCSDFHLKHHIGLSCDSQK